jgi:hypothetical protein
LHKYQGASFHRCHIVREALKRVCSSFERVCAKTSRAAMAIYQLAVAMSVSRLLATSFVRNPPETSTAANALAHVRKFTALRWKVVEGMNA